MTDFLLLMHSGIVDDKLAADGTLWAAYLNALHAGGQFDGSSSVGTVSAFADRKCGIAD
jgi:hypothetical protein